MAEYRRLVSEERIEFVTFHQSMSYEEFNARNLAGNAIRAFNERLAKR